MHIRIASSSALLLLTLSTSCAHAPSNGAPAPTAACAAPAVLCWDFEEGTPPAGWTPHRDEFSGQLLVDDTRAHRGRYALHARGLSGGKEGTQGGPKKTFRFDLPAHFGPVLWGRAWVYTTPERPMSHAGLFSARYPRPGHTGGAFDTLDWYEVATWQQKYMAIWHPPEPPGFPESVRVSSTPLVLDAWACLEWLFDGANDNHPEAAMPRVWLDGVELDWPQQFVFSDPPTATPPVREKATDFTVVETGVILYQGLTVPTDWWLDDLAIGRQRLGCGADPAARQRHDAMPSASKTTSTHLAD